jgi:hypothetical protein
VSAAVLPSGMGGRRGRGTMRQRRTGVWEIRAALGVDPASGHTRQRSITVHGDEAAARQVRADAARLAAFARRRRRGDATVTVGELLGLWLDADLGWRPSTAVGYRSIAAFLSADPLGRHRASALTPPIARAACSRWLSTGTGEATVWGRVRPLRAAVRWAVSDGILLLDPLAGLHGPRSRRPAGTSQRSRSAP